MTKATFTYHPLTHPRNRCALTIASVMKFPFLPEMIPRLVGLRLSLYSFNLRCMSTVAQKVLCFDFVLNSAFKRSIQLCDASTAKDFI